MKYVLKKSPGPVDACRWDSSDTAEFIDFVRTMMPAASMSFYGVSHPQGDVEVTVKYGCGDSVSVPEGWYLVLDGTEWHSVTEAAFLGQYKIFGTA